MSDKAVMCFLNGILDRFRSSFVIAVICITLDIELEVSRACSDPLKSRLGSLQEFIGEVDRHSVVTRKDEESDDFIREMLNDIPDRKEVTERLTHLLTVNIYESIVYPVICKCAAVSRFTLSDLVLVVREDKILSAAMNIDRITEVLLDHCGALDMPAGSSLSPGRIPEGFAFLLELPESKVAGILLTVIGSLSLTSAGI